MKLRIYSILFIIMLASNIKANSGCNILTDSIKSNDSIIPNYKKIDITENNSIDKHKIVVDNNQFSPSPRKAVIMAIICPGLGQIYNRKYWKLPLLYGGFVGLTYAISWNNTQYKGYLNAYTDLVKYVYYNDDSYDSWKNYIGTINPENIDKEKLGDILKNQKDFFRRNRDLSIIATIGLYVLSIIDAYVDASLFDFNMSEDLSMSIYPTIIQNNNINFTDNTPGLNIRLNF